MLKKFISDICFFQVLDIPQGYSLLDPPSKAKTLEMYKITLLLDTMAYKPVYLDEIPSDIERDFVGNKFYVNGQQMRTEEELTSQVKDEELLSYFSQEILVTVIDIYSKHYHNNKLDIKMFSYGNPAYGSTLLPKISADLKKREITASGSFFIKKTEFNVKIELFVKISLNTGTCVATCSTHPEPKVSLI
ncbi:MAG: hypothetical protein K940chlam8_00721 [Chlamydiae bacterium]|nr:hypothetical protein [Chlamydiota bacterium]